MRAAAGSFTALATIIYNWAGEAKAEFKTALAPVAIIVLMAITFLCNGVAGVPPESLRQAVVNAQLLPRADSR
jgi:ABC-type phosphate transport system permease subunit